MNFFVGAEKSQTALIPFHPFLKFIHFGTVVRGYDLIRHRNFSLLVQGLNSDFEALAALAWLI